MTAYKIPLSNIPQRFSIDIVGVNYTITCRWNEAIGWNLDIADGVTDTTLVSCLPLVTGCDLLGQLGYLGIGAGMVVYTDGDQYEPPTLDNLGIESNLYLLVTP